MFKQIMAGLVVAAGTVVSMTGLQTNKAEAGVHFYVAPHSFYVGPRYSGYYHYRRHHYRPHHYYKRRYYKRRYKYHCHWRWRHGYRVKKCHRHRYRH